MKPIRFFFCCVGIKKDIIIIIFTTKSYIVIFSLATLPIQTRIKKNIASTLSMMTCAKLPTTALVLVTTNPMRKKLMLLRFMILIIFHQISNTLTFWRSISDMPNFGRKCRLSESTSVFKKFYFHKQKKFKSARQKLEKHIFFEKIV